MVLFRIGYVFFIVLEAILFIYIVCSWLPVSIRLRNFLYTLVNPLMIPIRYLMRHSIFQAREIDLSPIIVFIVLTALQQLCQNFMNVSGLK